jgi:hypothetical protein
MLALTRALGNRDLARLSATDDAMFFPLLGRLVTYPQALAWPLAGLAVLAVTACAVAARRRRLTTVPRLLTGTAAALIPLIAAPAAAAGLWALLVVVRPGYAALSLGDPYRPTLYRWALGAVTATVVLAWFVALRRRVGALALTIGALVWAGVLAVATAALLPDAAHYGTVPAAAGGAGTLAAVLLGPGRPRRQLAAAAAAPHPGSPSWFPPVRRCSASSESPEASPGCCSLPSGAYLSSSLVQDRNEDLKIFCKAFPVRNGPRFAKPAFTIDFDQQLLNCPNNIAIPFVPGGKVQFPARRLRCLPAAYPMHHQHPRAQRAAPPDERLLAELPGSRRGALHESANK